MAAVYGEEFEVVNQNVLTSPEQSGDTVTITRGTASVNEDDFELASPSPTPAVLPDWGIQLELDYGFQTLADDDALQSRITIQINGTCIETSECDFTFGFGTITKYFVWLSDFNGGLRAIASGPKGIFIFPSCEGNALADGELLEILDGVSNPCATSGDCVFAQRAHMVGGNGNDWFQVTADDVNNMDTWPITLEMTNDNVNNQVTVKFTSAQFPETNPIICVYDGVLFPTDEGLQVGFNPDPADENWIMSEIKITRLKKPTIKECDDDESNNCDENAICIELPVGFKCQCRYGFKGDGKTCVPIVIKPKIVPGVAVIPQKTEISLTHKTEVNIGGDGSSSYSSSDGGSYGCERYHDEVMEEVWKNDKKYDIMIDSWTGVTYIRKDVVWH